ncbi:hypothetical protein BCV71DRAFT_233783 [Rhizopus microsporus]|uniref:PiggyBac transposable element-derived protein domain-containing protein n=1 Tax=Rhizopus microsporus TaxID=58291 RepID=A0A1X0S6A0_RHIZD|nr:hypothetical protein BCV71DRAFT_233783 [Rhizopus microsporus]
MKKLTTTVERLVKSWFGSGRIIIADSWFSSLDMTSMLMNHGLYSTMQATKHIANGKMFVCTFRIQKVKAFVSSCGTTRLTGEKTLKPSDGNPVTIKRPEVVDECERHKSSVDAASNLCDNLTSYHDIISTERCEVAQDSNRMLRSDSNHSYFSMSNANNKRKRLVCRKCKESGTNGKRIEKLCNCDPTTPLCFECHNQYLKAV